MSREMMAPEQMYKEFEPKNKKPKKNKNKNNVDEKTTTNNNIKAEPVGNKKPLENIMALRKLEIRAEEKAMNMESEQHETKKSIGKKPTSTVEKTIGPANMEVQTNDGVMEDESATQVVENAKQSRKKPKPKLEKKTVDTDKIQQEENANKRDSQKEENANRMYIQAGENAARMDLQAEEDAIHCVDNHKTIGQESMEVSTTHGEMEDESATQVMEKTKNSKKKQKPMLEKTVDTYKLPTEENVTKLDSKKEETVNKLDSQAWGNDTKMDLRADENDTNSVDNHRTIAPENKEVQTTHGVMEDESATQEVKKTKKSKKKQKPELEKKTVDTDKIQKEENDPEMNLQADENATNVDRHARENACKLDNQAGENVTKTENLAPLNSTTMWNVTEMDEIIPSKETPMDNDDVQTENNNLEKNELEKRSLEIKGNEIQATEKSDENQRMETTTESGKETPHAMEEKQETSMRSTEEEMSVDDEENQAGGREEQKQKKPKLQQQEKEQETAGAKKEEESEKANGETFQQDGQGKKKKKKRGKKKVSVDDKATGKADLRPPAGTTPERKQKQPCKPTNSTSEQGSSGDTENDRPWIQVKAKTRDKTRGNNVGERTTNRNKANRTEDRYKEIDESDWEDYSEEEDTGRKKGRKSGQRSQELCKPYGSDKATKRAHPEFRMEEIRGDLFKCAPTDSLAHCVSQDLHMGKGIAKAFRDRFGHVPDLKAQKKEVGEVAVLKLDGRFIYYLVTKGRYFEKPTYKTLQESLESMKQHCVTSQVTNLSMNTLGCGLDQLTWGRVRKTLVDVFQDIPIHIKVYYIK